MSFMLVGTLLPWVHPAWLVCAGIAMAVLVLLGIYGLAALALPKLAAWLHELALDGLAQPLFYASLLPAVLGLALAPFGISMSGEGNAITRAARGVLGLVWNVEDSVPQDRWIVWTSAVIVLMLFGFFAVLQLAVPKICAVAMTTTREGLAQWQFWVCLAGGAALLLWGVWIPFNTFGEDIKLLKETSLKFITVLSMLLAVLTASVSIADEIEGKTAMTVLSKPIGRREFVLGKFLGLLGPVLIIFFLLGLILMGTVCYKVIYDAGETGNIDMGVDECRAEMVQTAPGLALGLMQVVMLTAISVAISTRLPMLPNLMICFAVYALGHLLPLLVESSRGKLESVSFFGQLLATVLPVLQHFDIGPAIYSSQMVTLDYILWAFIYCLLFTAFALLGALVLFEDRDLA